MIDEVQIKCTYCFENHKKNTNEYLKLSKEWIGYYFLVSFISVILCGLLLGLVLSLYVFGVNKIICNVTASKTIRTIVCSYIVQSGVKIKSARCLPKMIETLLVTALLSDLY